MENKIIKSDKNIDLDYKSYTSLSNEFIKTFNEIFKYNDKEITIIVLNNEPWFKGKEIAEILEYDKPRKAIVTHVNGKYIRKYVEILGLQIGAPLNIQPHTIFISEAGLYSLIMKSKMNKAQEFQDFVFDQILPSLRKYSQQKYLDEINKRGDKIDELSNKLDNISKQNQEQTSEILKLSDNNNKLLKQNQLALEKLQELGISLNESREETKIINSKLDKVIEDRNIKPEINNLHHQYVLLQSKNDDREFKFLRGQKQYINNQLKEWNKIYNVVIDSTNNPNPIDLYNRFKIRIKNIVKRKIKEIKNDISLTKQEKEAKMNYVKSNPPIKFDNNSMILHESLNENYIIKILKKIEKEKYIV